MDQSLLTLHCVAIFVLSVHISCLLDGNETIDLAGCSHQQKQRHQSQCVNSQCLVLPGQLRRALPSDHIQPPHMRQRLGLNSDHRPEN